MMRKIFAMFYAYAVHFCSHSEVSMNTLTKPDICKLLQVHKFAELTPKVSSTAEYTHTLPSSLQGCGFKSSFKCEALADKIV